MARKLSGRLQSFVIQRGSVATIARALFANVLIQVVNVGTGIITARYLGPEGRGEQVAMALWPQFLAYGLTLGLPSALLYNLRRYPERASYIFPAALGLSVVMGLVAMIAGILLVPYWISGQYSEEVVSYARWLMIATPVVLVNLVLTYALRAREEFGTYNAVRYLQPLLTLASLLALALSGNLTPLSAALSYILPIVPIMLYMLVRLWRIYRPVWREVRSSSRDLSSYGVRSYGADVVGTLASELDRALVVGFLNPAAMGLYVVALSLSRLLDVFQHAVVGVLFPRAMGRDTAETVTLAARGARVSTAVTLLAASGLALFGPQALALVYGPDFIEASSVFRMLLLVVTLNGATWVLSQAFMALGRPGLITVLQAMGVAMSLLLLLLLVPAFGLEGAGLALLIAAVLRLAAILTSFPLVLGVRVPRMLPTREDIAEISRSLRREE